MGALGSETDGNRSTAVGRNALYTQNFTTDTDSWNTAVGFAAGEAVTTGTANTLIGGLAGDLITTGYSNVAVGYAALSTDDVGRHSTAIGDQSLFSQNTASAGSTKNTAVGHGAGYYNVTGTSNTYIGYGSGQGASTESNNSNTAVGSASMFSITNGDYNTALGEGAGYYVTTGDYNVSIGRAADQVTTGGTHNVCIGGLSKPSGAGSSHELVLGYNVTGSGSSTFTFGNAGSDTTIGMGTTTWSNPSDARIKEDIKDEEIGLSFINDLRPRTFRYRKEKDIPEELNTHVADSEERLISDKYQHGFVAQEVKEAIDKHSGLKDGFGMWSEDESDGKQRVGETAIIPILVKAIQELSAEITKLKGE